MSFKNEEILKVIKTIENESLKKGTISELWDGNATERIIEKCINFIP